MVARDYGARGYADVRSHCSICAARLHWGDMEQLTVVISGFDPYEGVSVNPSLVVPDALANEGVDVDRDNIEDPLHDVAIDVHAVHVPVSFRNGWAQLHDTLEQVQPNIVIATGLKRAARGILLERCAINLKDTTRPDAENVIPGRRVINEHGPAAYWTGLPLRAILNAFAKDDIPATLSSDAGTFVCNALFYHLQEWAAQRGDTMGGFVNLPLVNEQPHPQHGLSLRQQIQAGKDLVRASARYYLQPTSEDILL
ncbi:peptidase C15 [Bifidobacterium anseris]|uniref:Pyroglutamyl-peptidase I n=3 Tax=Bifidobacterium TaxID=1678 RepID=A0A2A2EML2_9BIFI|nr:peptidase C15 [Bifidobacterium italicum]PLS26905.1 peptidase C15 [Bifidobacterium anseris]